MPFRLLGELVNSPLVLDSSVRYLDSSELRDEENSFNTFTTTHLHSTHGSSRNCVFSRTTYSES
jgi:hypothetical protein